MSNSDEIKNNDDIDIYSVNYLENEDKQKCEKIEVNNDKQKFEQIEVNDSSELSDDFQEIMKDTEQNKIQKDFEDEKETQLIIFSDESIQVLDKIYNLKTDYFDEKIKTFLSDDEINNVILQSVNKIIEHSEFNLNNDNLDLDKFIDHFHDKSFKDINKFINKINKNKNLKNINNDFQEMSKQQFLINEIQQTISNKKKELQQSFKIKSNKKKNKSKRRRRR